MITMEKFVSEWIKDLRSGEYSQTTEQLSDGDCYCCLGVACLTGKRLGIEGSDFNPHDSQQEMSDSLPGVWFKKIMGYYNPWILISKDYPISDGSIARGSISCAEANDELGFSFNEIADALEKTYLKDKNGTAEN